MSAVGAFISREAQLQRNIDATGMIFCIAWVVLSAARDLYSATHYLGGTAVTAPPFFDTAARSDTLFWHPDSKCISGSPADSPLVMALADFTDRDFEENYAPYLQRRQDWVILTPPLPNGAKKKAFLEQYGHKVAIGQGKVYRERGWWMSGLDALASYATPLEGWVSTGQTPDAKRVSALTGALQNTAAHDPPLFDTSKMAQLFQGRYRNGSPGPSFIRPPCIRHRWVIRGWTHGSGGLHSPVRKSAPM